VKDSFTNRKTATFRCESEDAKTNPTSKIQTQTLGQTKERTDRGGGIPAFLSHARQPPRHAEPPLCRRGEPHRAKGCKGKCRRSYGLRAAKHRRGAPRRRRAHTPVDARAGERAHAGAAISSGQASVRPAWGWRATVAPPPPAPPRAAAARCSARKDKQRASEGFGWRGDGAAMAPPPNPTVRRQESCRWRVGREKKGGKKRHGPWAGSRTRPCASESHWRHRCRLGLGREEEKSIRVWGRTTIGFLFERSVRPAVGSPSAEINGQHLAALLG
jgi:hypothetical protein